MTQKSGLILVNLGSPDAPTARSVRKYLFEFLHDKRVIETSRWIWCPILHGIILRVRPARSAKNYKKIWHTFNGKDDDEAPLVRITRDQASGVRAELGDNVVVDVAMRYGKPSIQSVLKRMDEQGITKIGVLPLYPQYAGATTASVYDGFHKAMKKGRDVPTIRFIRDYHDHPEYIDLLANSIETFMGEVEKQPDVILASFHGMPQSYIDKGDPYQKECARTVELLRNRLAMSDKKLKLTFQSRFGPKAWLQPYTDKVLKALAEEGSRSVAIITPGFAADCLETLEEIDMEARETFLEAGGQEFHYIPCLNANPAHNAFLAELAKDELLTGWL